MDDGFDASPSFHDKSGFQFPSHFDSEYLPKENAAFEDVIYHRNNDMDMDMNDKFGFAGINRGFAGKDAGFGEKMAPNFPANLPDNFHDADSSTKVTSDGKVINNKYEIHKTKGKDYNGFSYSTSNSVTW